MTVLVPQEATCGTHGPSIFLVDVNGWSILILVQPTGTERTPTGTCTGADHHHHPSPLHLLVDEKTKAAAETRPRFFIESDKPRPALLLPWSMQCMADSNPRGFGHPN